MGRWLLNLLAAASVLAGVAVAACWVRSRTGSDNLSVEVWHGYGLTARSGGGAVTVGIDRRAGGTGEPRVEVRHAAGEYLPLFYSGWPTPNF